MLASLPCCMLQLAHCQHETFSNSHGGLIFSAPRVSCASSPAEKLRISPFFFQAVPFILFFHMLLLTCFATCKGDKASRTSALENGQSLSLSPLEGLVLGTVISFPPGFISCCSFRSIFCQWGMSARRRKGEHVLAGRSRLVCLVTAMQPLSLEVSWHKCQCNQLGCSTCFPAFLAWFTISFRSS